MTVLGGGAVSYERDTCARVTGGGAMPKVNSPAGRRPPTEGYLAHKKTPTPLGTP